MAHMHYKGTGRVHSFRGLLGAAAQDEINIEGSVGAIAWRITKFEIMPTTPGADTGESIVKIYREEQASVDGVISFSDAELLAAGFYVSTSNQDDATNTAIVVFDNALFSRNIFVTNHAQTGGVACNYYFELEEVTLSTAGKAQLALAAARRTGDR